MQASLFSARLVKARATPLFLILSTRPHAIPYLNHEGPYNCLTVLFIPLNIASHRPHRKYSKGSIESLAHLSSCSTLSRSSTGGRNSKYQQSRVQSRQYHPLFTRSS